MNQIENILRNKTLNHLLFDYLVNSFTSMRFSIDAKEVKNEIESKKLALFDKLFHTLFGNLFEEHYHAKILKSILIEYKHIQNDRNGRFHLEGIVLDVLNVFFSYFNQNNEHKLITKSHFRFLVDNNKFFSWSNIDLSILLGSYDRFVQKFKTFTVKAYGSSDKHVCEISWVNEVGLARYRIDFDLYNSGLFSKEGTFDIEECYDAELVHLDEFRKLIPINPKFLYTYRRKIVYYDEIKAMSINIFDIINFDMKNLCYIKEMGVKINADESLITCTITSDVNLASQSRYSWEESIYHIDALKLEILDVEHKSEVYKH